MGFVSQGHQRVTKRQWAWLFRAVTAALVILSISSAGAVDTTSEPVVRIEENWQLVLNEPDDAADAPQFHTAMSPSGSLEGMYLQTSWNYWGQTDFSSGGLQLQAWNSNACNYHKGFFDGQQLSVDSETITWTQVLAVTGNGLLYGIMNGQSTTWGAFGGGTMFLAGNGSVTNLDGYRPEVSTKNSWITYGANRVEKLVLTGVRYYGVNGLLYEDATPRVIFQSPSTH